MSLPSSPSSTSDEPVALIGSCVNLRVVVDVAVAAAVFTCALLLAGCPEEPAAEPPPPEDTRVEDSGPAPAPEVEEDAGPAPQDTPEPSVCPAGEVVIHPEKARTSDALEATLTGPSPAAVLFTWFRVEASGQRTQVGSGPVLPSAVTSKGETFEVTVASALDPDCGVLTDQMTIANTPPLLTWVAVSPSAAMAGQQLLCSVPPGAWLDPDDDPTGDVAVAWLNGDAVIAGATSAELSTGFGKGDSVRCQLTPNDGEDNGAPVLSAAVPIVSSAPQTTAVSLECPAPGEPLHCTAEGDDADGDDVFFVFDFYAGPGSCGDATLLQAGSQAVTGEFGSSLSTTPIKGTPVFCCATPHDDAGSTGSPEKSGVCTVPNQPPEVTGAIVGAAGGGPPKVGSTLTCNAGASDPDGDVLSTTCLWFADSDPIGVDDASATEGAGEGCALDEGFVKGQSVCCQVVADDGTVTTTSATKSCVTIADSPPSIVDVSVQPGNGDHCAPITCSALATDPDGDTVDVLYAWKVDGAPVGGAPDAVPDQEVACTATPVAAGAVGAAATATALIGNDVPSLAGVNVVADPSPPGAGSTLTCVPDGWTDVDFCDTAVYQYTWYLNGVEVEGETTDALAPGAAGKGDSVLCLVAPGDGYAYGPPVQSGVVVLANTAPAVISVTVSPPVGNHGTEFTCGTEVDDPDQDPVTWLYTWSVNGEVVDDETGPTAQGVPFETNGALLTCTAQPFDSGGAGPEVPSANAAVLVNTPPLLTAVKVTPTEPDTLDDLHCTAAATDPDGDATTLTYEWFEVTSAGPQILVEQTGPVLIAAETEHFDAIYCRATPHDGKSDGAAQASEAVQVLNTPPELGSVTLDPAGGTALTTFTCVAEGYVDIDDDPEAVQWRWRIDGELVQGATAAALQPVAYGGAVGATVSCEATPFDGFDPGDTLASNPAVLSACAPDQDGKPCDDGNACTTADICSSGPGAPAGGACVGTPISCDDGNPCTADGCDPEAGCTVTPTTQGCDDLDPCTNGDVCTGGDCVGQPVPCDDGNACTTDSCNPVAGCLHFPAISTCEDNNPCTAGDLCSNGQCVSGGPTDCSDSDPCTTDGCDATTGCTHTTNAASCDDGDPCTSNEHCVGGACQPGGLTDCDDGNECTADGCTQGVGCTHQPLPSGTQCEDGDICTAEDGCEGGACKGGPPPPCDDGNPCTADGCLSGVGCSHTAQDGVCENGSVCKDGECCTSDCGVKDCGDDGCGGSCGVCVATEECVDPPGACSPAITDGMVLVPSGDFWMGCNEAADASCGQDEHPYHLVMLPAYEIDEQEATVAEYKACVDEGGCTEATTAPFGCLWSKPGVDGHPVNCVDWYGAESYCGWMGKRLCTEAEWEKAARGVDGRLWPWGDLPATCALAVMKEGTSLGCGIGSPWPAGLIEDGASPYGALDMAGNVAEWVADWYYGKYYASSPTVSPEGPGFGLYRVYRGGGYENTASKLRVSNREVLQADNLSPAVGIRCCRTFP